MLALPSYDILTFPCFLLKIKYSYAQNLISVFMITWEIILKFC